MTKLTVKEIAEATGGKVLYGEHNAFSGISIDSRKASAGELFVAIKGEKFDGHDFVSDALKQADGALVSREPAAAIPQKTVILVDDTLRALQAIARYRREKRNVPVIAVTGTNGKTTTKELIASILSRKHKVLKTTGNLNNHIGLPLCVTNMEGDEDFMVLEMGSNAAGDIRLLCSIARPDIAVVTNVGQAHLEGFGSLTAVRDTDLEVMEHVKTLCLNADDSFLLEGASGFSLRKVTYGIDSAADYSAENIRSEGQGSGFVLRLPGRDAAVMSTRLAGRFNVLNAVGAAAVAAELGIDTEDIRTGIGSFSGVPMRLEILEYSGAIIINDVYNANPASMESALAELARLRQGRAVAVLGDMLELGAYAEQAHAELIERLNGLGVDILITAGPEMQRASAGFRGAMYIASTSDEARIYLLDNIKGGDVVLIKGSRGMRMENVLGRDGRPLAAEGADAL